MRGRGIYWLWASILALFVALWLLTAEVDAVHRGTCRGWHVTILGSNEDDTIFGTDKHDVIRARRGDDIIFGGDKNDVICGGPGDDYLDGGDGYDRGHAGKGDDVCVDTEKESMCEM